MSYILLKSYRSQSQIDSVINCKDEEKNMNSIERGWKGEKGSKKLKQKKRTKENHNTWNICHAVAFYVKSLTFQD